MDGEAQNARGMLKPYLKDINENPVLLSLLYDADMLPEQTVTVRGAICTMATVIAFKEGKKLVEKREAELLRALGRIANTKDSIDCRAIAREAITNNTLT